MKLIRAQFENFRLLRDLELDFSTDNIRKLTVIRAENETGKTTILNGLQWAFYGDDALPGKGLDHRLHPIDWETLERTQIPISVQVEFEITKLRQRRKGAESIETKERYCIIRSAYETLNDQDYKRSPSNVKLFLLTDKGSKPIEPPDAWIAEELPVELRGLFFTDGDRALRFIEATETLKTKRERVEIAIRALLGLGVIEDALKHVRKTASKINKEAKDIGEDEELITITAQLEQIENQSEELEEKIKDSSYQFAVFSEKLDEIQKEIAAVLSRGDREKLKSDLAETKSRLESLDTQRDEAGKAHANLFTHLFLARDVLSSVLGKSLAKLSDLRDKGKIPHATIPVLEERLRGTTCICGESLDPHNPHGKHRREHIQDLINESRQADELQSSLADLYYGSRPLQSTEGTDGKNWIAEYTKIVEQRDELDNQRNTQGKKLKALEAQLDRIPDTDIQGLRSTERDYIKQRDRFNIEKTRDQTLLEGLVAEHKKLARKRDNLLRQQGKWTHILAQLDVVRDVERVLENSYNQITNEELAKVSQLMNDIFLEMIGADPEQGAIIRKAEISKDFDILVYGSNDRALNPDRDLNGASRRALTLAFILALTKVSEVEAPNVIDTPLGMMSDFVKRSVLKTAIRESAQIVLFLTRSEIADCEKIIDAEAGEIITLTNSAHYPLMLVNDPQIKQRKVLRCECNHHQECSLCERRVEVNSSNSGGV